ncbi:nectin-1-like isoform X2 [Hypanus sabinus]|uniref:nectin-1-like isoform X2 n=1 Tax=Hypanus sabinus TaxID=79690 RepID=UPI0028C4D0B0|nr:nectin-1-like isoform X2 [Hypanus sabinus]
MGLILCLLICYFLCTGGKHHVRPELKNQVTTKCNVTENVVISQSQWHVEINKTVHFFGVILQNSSLENMVCAKELMRAFKNSCAASGNHVTLTVLIQPFSAKYQKSLKDQLVTMCRNTKGGLAENTVWISSEARRKYEHEQQNASRTVACNYKSTRYSNHLENITCLINHPPTFTPLELFIRYPFGIRIKSNSHGVKGRKNSEGIIQVEITGSVEKVDFSCSKKNGSFPEGIELIKNHLIFKGPMRESYPGKYVCVASNQQWKLSAQWEIEITSDENHWIPTRPILIASCVLFTGVVSFFCILRWYKRKQLVVIPQQYSVQNFGYQTTMEDPCCIKIQQDPGIGAGSVSTPVNSQKKH